MQSLPTCLDPRLLLDPSPRKYAVPGICSLWSHTQDFGMDHDLKMYEGFSQTAPLGHRFGDTDFPSMQIEPGRTAMRRMSTLSSSTYYSNSDTVESSDSSLDLTCKPCEEQVDGSDHISLRGFPSDDENELKRTRHSRVEKNYRNRVNYKFDSLRETLKETTCKGGKLKKGKRGRMSRVCVLDMAQETISNLSLENKSLHREVQRLSTLMREVGGHSTFL